MRQLPDYSFHEKTSKGTYSVPGTEVLKKLCFFPLSPIKYWKMYFYLRLGFPGGSDGKASACSAGDPGSIPGLGRCPGEENGNPLQYSCLENSMDGEAPQSLVGYSPWGHKESDMTE